MQYGRGLDHHPPSDANGLGVADGYAKKDRDHNHLLSWLPVRAPIHAFVLSGADVYVHSVCVVTLILLILSTQLRLDDYTYTILKVSIVTVLEPLLAIVIACLPLFPPALKRTMGAVRKTKSETPIALSTTLARLRVKRSKSSAFQSLDDSFPLTELEGKRTQNHISGPNGKLDYVSECYGKIRGMSMPPQPSILVERDWEVRSDEVKRPEEKV